MIKSPPSQLNGTSKNLRTLPASYYTSEEVLTQEKYSLFFKSWQFVGHVDELPNVGDYKTVSIFDQNIILTRTQISAIKAYYNVCPHRGHQLVEEDSSGQKRAFTCPYHAWTYSLDGKLQGARGVNEATGVDKSEICLFEIRVDQLIDFIFINLDPNAVPLNEFYPGLAEQLAEVDPTITSYKPYFSSDNKKPRSSHWNANWKVLIDNFLECYHCETAHPTYSKKLCVPDTVRNVHEHYTHEVTPLSPEPSDWPHPVNLEHDALESHFWFLFPSTAIGRAAGVPNFYISRFDPLSVETTDRTTIAILPAEWSDPDAPRRAKMRLESGGVTGEEDQYLCENVQKGMHQLGFQQGWYINDPDAHNISEHALQYFHELYLDAMNPAD